MDHRGTGQTTHLQCEKAQTGSSSSSDWDPSQIPACAQELEEKFGDLAAFSTTSAATDLVTFISEYGNGFSTAVYGMGYGTMWVERVTHLNPPEVTGYVLDGVATTSGVSPDKFPYLTSADASFSEVGGEFLALCSEDSVCNFISKRNDLNPRFTI